MAGTANIGKNGGIIEVTASTSTESNNMTGATNQPWLSIYETGNTLLASATPNTNANSREASLSATVSTVSTASYPVVATINCAWTITQAGTGTTPTTDVSIHFQFYYTGDTTTLYPQIKGFVTASTGTYSTPSWTPSNQRDTSATSINIGAATGSVSVSVRIVRETPDYMSSYKAVIMDQGQQIISDIAVGGGSIPAVAELRDVSLYEGSTQFTFIAPTTASLNGEAADPMN